MVRAAIAACFFLTGAASLVLEVCWTRVLGLAIGRSNLAVTCVLTAFMGGLAIGGLLGGRLAARNGRERLLLVYAALEAGVALSSLISLPVLGWLRAWLLEAGILDRPPVWQAMAWFSVASLVLVVPTALMGASLPVLVGWWGSRAGEEGAGAGLLYGLNTFGAALGAAAAGYLLLPVLGDRGTLRLACAVAAAAAMAAAALSQWEPEAPLSSQARRAEDGEAGAAALPAVVLFLSGAGSMAAEVAFTRALASVLGSSVHAFTAMLVTFLGGIALGAAAYRRLAARAPGTLAGLARLQLCVAAALLLSLALLGRLPYLVLCLPPAVQESFPMLQAAQFALCALAMAGPAALAGAAFPWALDAGGTTPRSAGADAGFYYCANTVGSVGGSLNAGLVLVPWIGAEATLAVAVGLHLAAALAAAAGTGLRRTVPAAAAAGLVLGALWARPRWDPLVMASGMFQYADNFRHLESFGQFQRSLAADRLLFYRDGESAGVAVLENPFGDRTLRINGKSDASLRGDMPTQLLSAYLPALLHAGRPRSALVIGLGSGATAGALARLGIRTEVVEIEPAVVEASAFFEEANRGLLRRPETTLRIADGRQVLAAPGARYDLISSEPSNPWLAGGSSFYTAEAFALARERLSPGGVFCQWFHGYSMGLEDFRSVAATFAAAFPHAMLLRSNVNVNDYFLLGSAGPWQADYASLVRRYDAWAAMRSDLASFGLGRPIALVEAAFVLGDADLRSWSRGGRALTDDRMGLEFSAPRFLHRSEHVAIESSLDAARRRPWPDGFAEPQVPAGERAKALAELGEAWLSTGFIERAGRAFERASEADPGSAKALVGSGRVHVLAGRPLKALEDFRKAVAADPRDAAARFHLGTLYLSQGMKEPAVLELRRCLSLAPGHPVASLLLGRELLLSGRLAEARKAAEAALARGGVPPDLRRPLEEVLRQASGGRR